MPIIQPKTNQEAIAEWKALKGKPALLLLGEEHGMPGPLRKRLSTAALTKEEIKFARTFIELDSADAGGLGGLDDDGDKKFDFNLDTILQILGACKDGGLWKALSNYQKTLKPKDFVPVTKKFNMYTTSIGEDADKLRKEATKDPNEDKLLNRILEIRKEASAVKEYPNSKRSLAIAMEATGWLLNMFPLEYPYTDKQAELTDDWETTNVEIKNKVKNADDITKNYPEALKIFTNRNISMVEALKPFLVANKNTPTVVLLCGHNHMYPKENPKTFGDYLANLTYKDKTTIPELLISNKYKDLVKDRTLIEFPELMTKGSEILFKGVDEDNIKALKMPK